MPRDPLQSERCAQLLSALAAPERLRIVRFLADGSRNVTEITDMLGIPAVNVSHHLNVLKTSQIIRGKKHGRFVYYSLSPGILAEAVGAGNPAETLDLGCCQLVLPGKPTTQSTEICFTDPQPYNTSDTA